LPLKLVNPQLPGSCPDFRHRFHFALESPRCWQHSSGRMKPITLFAVALFLTAAASQSRADETNTAAVIISAQQAGAHLGKQVTVTGVVAQVSFRPSLVFLNFDKPYPDSPFTAIIRNSHTNEFDQLSALKGKSIAVEGKVKDYNGKPEIELTGKSQLKILSETK
jgi:DNA/RNA endonuclease YhcR with UshA esterase domain